MAIDVKALSSWVRQLRHRAKKHNLYNDLSIQEIQSVIKEYKNLCCFCGCDSEVLDMAYPLRNGAPNIQANVLPLCKGCKDKKGNNDLTAMYTLGVVDRDIFLMILKSCFNRNNGDVLRTHVRALSGHIDD
jgi:5-methylcytosine-specific restriction endonuclease McrA